ncbi:30S ribosomal protein S7 [Candidatus Hodgkinia cicadicola]
MGRRYKLIKAREPGGGIGNVVLAKLTNYLMLHGKKSVALKVLNKALNYIARELACNPMKILYEALDNITPYSEVRSKKVGGVSYRVPVDLTSERRLSIALKWLVASARLRKEANTWMRLAREIVDAALMQGIAYRRFLTARDLVLANQAFSHLGW